MQTQENNASSKRILSRKEQQQKKTLATSRLCVRILEADHIPVIELQLDYV